MVPAFVRAQDPTSSATPAGEPPTTAPAPPAETRPTPVQATPPVSTAPTGPVPVIPETQPLLPPATIPSAPQRVLPEALGVPPTAVFQLQSGVTFSEEYTDNFNLTRTDKESNFRSSLSPALRLIINSAFTKGVIGYTFSPSHDSSTDDVQYFQSLLGQVTWEANPRWRLTLADVLTRSDQPADADRLGLRQQRQTFTSNTFALTSDYLIGTIATQQYYRLSMFDNEDGAKTTSHVAGLSATVPLYSTNSLTSGYEYLTSETDEGGGDGPISDRSRQFGDETSGHRVTAAFTRQVSTLRSVGLASSYAFRRVTDDSGDNDFQLWNVSAFTKYTLPGRLTLRGSLGLSGLVGESGISDGPNVSTASSLTYQFVRTIVVLSLDRGFSETFSDGENFGVVKTEGATGSLSYSFTPNVSGTVSGFYRRNRFTDAGSVDSSDGDRTQNWGGALALSWRIWRSILVDLSYTYLKYKDQDNADNNYSENRVRAGLSLSF
jgi:hypothetical protein